MLFRSFANPGVTYFGKPVSPWARKLASDPTATHIGHHYFTTQGQHYPQRVQIGEAPQAMAEAPLPPQRPGELAFLGHPAAPPPAPIEAPPPAPIGVAAAQNALNPTTPVTPSPTTPPTEIPIPAQFPNQVAANVPLPPSRPEGLGAASIGKPVAPMQTAALPRPAVAPHVQAPTPRPMQHLTPRPVQQAPIRRASTGVKPQQAMAYADTEQPFYIDQLFQDLGFKRGGSVRTAYENGGGRPNAEELYNYLIKEKGATPSEALVLTPAAGAESTYNPTVSHDQGTGYGLFGHRLDRLANMRQETGSQYPDWRQQAGFALGEFRGRPEHSIVEGENPSARDIMSAHMAYERPAGYKPGHPELGKGYGKRLGLTEAMMRGDFSGAPSSDDIHMKNLPDNARSFMALDQGAPSGVKPAEKTQGISGFLRGTAPADMSEKAADFLTSERFIVPVLSGLAAAANYPDRRYTGSAILSGLGAAGQAYMQVPKTEAETEEKQSLAEKAAAEAREAIARAGETGAREAETRSKIPTNALVVDSNTGTILGVKVYVGNKLKVISVKDYFDAQRRGENYQLAPSGGYGGSEPSEPATTIDIGEPPAGGAGTKAPKVGAKAAPIGGEQPQAPIGGQLGKSDMDFAKDAAKDVQQAGFKYLEKSPEANPFEAQSQAAAVAANNLQQRNALAKSLGGLQEKGIVTAGKFSTEVSTPIVQWVNSALDAMNAPQDFRLSSADQLSNAEVAKKLSTLLATRQTTAAGQHANAALSTLLSATPSQLNTPKGAAALVSDLFINDQRDMDLDRYYRNMRKYAEETSGINQAQSQFIGRGMRDRYFGEREKMYSKEKKALQDMYLQPFRYKDESGQMRDTHLMNFIIERGGSVPPNLAKEIEKRYGSGILRYFTGQQ